MTNIQLVNADVARGGKFVRVADGRTLKSSGIGSISFFDGAVVLKDVRIMLGLDMNVISISALSSHGWQLTFPKNEVEICKDSYCMKISKQDGIYPVSVADDNDNNFALIGPR
jgi:hypothetical protein